MQAKSRFGYDEVSEMDGSELPLGSEEVEAFRRRVLAGCRQLGVEALRQLADDIHAYARARRNGRSFAHDAEADAKAVPIQLSSWRT